MTALHILYLEDNPDHVALVEGVLQPQFPGSRIDNTTHMAEALASLTRQRYDVVLVCAELNHGPLDQHLEELSGSAQGSPLIVIAGAGDEKKAANAIKHGATDYLIKSRESLEVLPYLIQRLLKKHRPIADSKSAVPAPVPNGALDHLLAEIDQVSRRVHAIHDAKPSEATLAGLRDELGQLKQLALQLLESRKNRKSL